MASSAAPIDQELRHVLLNDLTVVRGYAELLLAERFGALTNEQRAAVEAAFDALKRASARLRRET
jgi:hypothetical protein